MNKVKKITLFLGIFILGLLVSTNVKAASANLSANKTSVNVGETVTVSVNVNAAAWEIHISGAVSGSYADTSENGENTNITKQLSFIPKSEGNYTVKMEGNVSEGSNNSTIPISSSVTITAKSSSSLGNSNTNNSNPTTPTKSNVATLSNLGIKPNDFSGFKANTYSYNVEVQNETEKIEVYASKGQSGQTISGTGTKTLKEGANTFNVVVTAEDGKTQKTYTINVTRKVKEEQPQDETEQPEQNSEEEPMEEVFGLTELNIEGLELEPQFQTDIYEYKLELKEDLEKLNITTLATEANSNIEIVGNEDLQEGENIITIIVTDENAEKTATYQIIVNKIIEKDTANQEQDHQQMIKRIIAISIAGGVILIIVIAVIVIKIKKLKESSNQGYIPYENVLDSYEEDEIENEQVEEIQEEEQIEDEFYDEVPKKKKRSKGKRFK